jgi:hypothetical protein
MRGALADGRIPSSFEPIVAKWEARNIAGFGQPKTSGDDCFETLDVQREYFHAIGFVDIHVVWHRELWAVLVGRKT